MAITRLYVGNLAFTTTAAEIRAVFAPYGNVVVNLNVDVATGRCRGSGNVIMGTEEEAKTAVAKLNGVQLNGRPIMVFVDSGAT